MMPIPVKCEWDLDSLGLDCSNDHPYVMEQTFLSSADMCASLLYPSEDLWKKFELLDNSNQNLKLLLDDSFTDDEGDLDVVFDCSSIGKAAREIRHHDCMWAGRCGSKDHKSFLAEHHSPRSTARKATRVAAKRECIATPSVVKSANSLLRTDFIVTPTSGRSLLRTPIKQVVIPMSMKDSSYALDSDGGSPRPDTPQTSESEDEEEHLVFKHNLDISSSVSAVCGDDSSDLLQYSEDYRTPSSEGSSSGCDDDDDDDGDDDDEEDDDEECEEYDIEVPSPSTAVAVSEVTGQQRPASLTVRPMTVIKQQHHFTGDHSYHQSNTPVDLDKLGVQTPSDSEEEIDVVSFCDGEQPTSRSSSCGGVSLPTNPSDQDRRQLQLAVKSAIATKKRSAETKVATSIRAIGDKILMDVRTIKNEVEVKNTMKARNSKKRTATSSDRDEEKGRFKGVKRAKHQFHHRMQHHKMMSPVRSKKAGSTGSSSPRSGGSDSEPESLEKRNLHNNMERQRRIDLRNLVEGLRLMVPSVETKNRAAKVIILREASNYCQYLTEQYEESSSELQALRMKQNKLRQRVSALRREAAKVR